MEREILKRKRKLPNYISLIVRFLYINSKDILLSLLDLVGSVDFCQKFLNAEKSYVDSFSLEEKTNSSDIIEGAEEHKNIQIVLGA